MRYKSYVENTVPYRRQKPQPPIDKSDDLEAIKSLAREFSAKNPDDRIEVWDSQQNNFPIMVFKGCK